jgi:hypothetical protein
MNQVERDELALKLLRILETSRAAHMLSPGEKVTLANDLASRLSEGPGWLTREILARRAAIRLVSNSASGAEGA